MSASTAVPSLAPVADTTTSPSSGIDYSALVQGSKDEVDQTLVIRQVVPEIVTFSLPFKRFGLVPIGGRSTAIRLDNATEPGTFVYVSHPLTPATKQAIDKLRGSGDVKWLVTPDGEHGMYIKEWSEAFPNAKPIGVARHKEKKPDIAWAGLYGDGGEAKTYGFEPEISLHQVSAHANHELVAIHHPTKTLLEADLMFNLPAEEQFSRVGQPGWFKSLDLGSKLQPGATLHDKFMHGVLTKGSKLTVELTTLKNAEWDRLIPCHGDVMESGAKEAWLKVFNPFL